MCVCVNDGVTNGKWKIYLKLVNSPTPALPLSPHVNSSTMLLVVVIPNESPVITRDYLSGVYPIPVYYFAIAFFYTIEVLINTTIIFHIVYWFVFNNTKVNALKAYPGVYVTMLLVSLVAIGVGMLISSVASTFSMALSLANPVQTVLMLYAGFLILDSEIPDVFRVFQYLSSWYYSLNVNMNLIYEDVGKVCPFPEPSDATMKELEEEMLKDSLDPRRVCMEMTGSLCRAYFVSSPNLIERW